MAKLKLNKKFGIVKTIAEVGVILLAIFFIGRFIWSGWAELVIHIKYARWSYVFLGIVLFLVYFVLRAYGWRLIMLSLGAKLSQAKASYIWFLSEFSRYIPGNIWSFAGRIYLSSKENVPKRISSLSLILEIFYLVGSSVVLGVLFFLVGPKDILHIPIWILIFIVPTILVIINPKILGKLINFLLRIIKKEPMEFNLSFFRSIMIFLLYTAAWLAYGFASYFTASAFVDLSNISVIWLVCGFVLSWAIGYLSFITPMGLGVREAAILTILKHVISGPLASLVAIVTRLALIVSELIALMSIFLIKMAVNRGLFSKMKKYLRENKASVVLGSMITAYIGYFMTLSFMKHANYLTSRYDLGNMDQTVWNTLHGHFFQLTNPELGTQVSRFFIHGDIFLVLLSPLYLIYSSPYTLLFVQTIALALGALPVYWLSKEVLKNKSLALAIVFSYLMYPGTQWANIFDFHSVTIATSLLLFTFYYAYKNKVIPFVIFALLSLTTKETIAFPLILICIYMIIARKNWKIAGAMIVIAAGWFFLLLQKIIPGSRGGSDQHFGLIYYQHLGNSPVDIIKNFFLEPTLVFDYITKNGRWYYLYLILAPTGFLALLSPFIILAIPGIAINILSSQSQMTTFFYHYTGDIAPFLFISSIFGLVFLIRTFRKYYPGSILTRENFYVCYIIVATLITSWAYSPLPYAKNPDTQAFTYRNPAKNYLDQLAKNMPSDYKVSATNRMSPHFSEREINYLFPNGIGSADFIVVEEGYQYELASGEEKPANYIIQRIRDLEKDTRYLRIYHNGNISVFRKNNVKEIDNIY